MKKGPDRDRPDPFLLRETDYCLVVAAASLEADGWLLDADVEGWPAEAEVDGWVLDAVVDGWLAEADVEGWLIEAEVDGWLAEAEDMLPEADAPPADSRPAMFAFACFAFSMAPWVFGPILPSTGPGSKPLSFSACCSCFTESSPACWPALALFDAEAPWLELAEGWLVEDEPMLELEVEGWFIEADVDGWLADAEEVAAGWLVEAEVEDLLSAAIAEPAAIIAATRASFLKVMVVVLSSYTGGTRSIRRAVHFGAWKGRKLQPGCAPSDARHLRGRYRGTAT